MTEPANERTALYRLFDADDVLLYVGISKHFGRRWQEHESSQPWWHEVDHQTVHWYPTREAAAAAEVEAIKAENPKYNIAHAAHASGQTEDLSRRFIALSAFEPGEGNYSITDIDVVAPGTYEMTFAYDCAAKPFAAVALSECRLIRGGDAVSQRLGGRVRPQNPVVPGEPAGQIDPATALAASAGQEESDPGYDDLEFNIAWGGRPKPQPDDWWYPIWKNLMRDPYATEDLLRMIAPVCNSLNMLGTLMRRGHDDPSECWVQGYDYDPGASPPGSALDPHWSVHMVHGDLNRWYDEPPGLDGVRAFLCGLLRNDVCDSYQVGKTTVVAWGFRDQTLAQMAGYVLHHSNGHSAYAERLGVQSHLGELASEGYAAKQVSAA